MQFHDRRHWAIAVLMTLVVFAAGPAWAVDSIRVSSEQWDEATHHDGTGLYWDIIRAVYEPAGVEVHERIVPYARSVREVTVTDKADAWVASYLDEVAGPLYPEWHFDADYVGAVYDPGRFDGVAGERALAGQRVAWMRGYAYDQYLSVEVDSTEVDDRSGGLRMVQEGRIDFFIDAQVEIDFALEDTGLGDTLASDIVLELPLYLAFADTDRGRELRAIWDERMPELLEQGVISRLYREYEWGSWPFDGQYR
jgi:polar amino acid transport system substrate-binding protein